ncbi:MULTISPECIES: helix-turn-helix domain-containing protein [Acinetobacter]|uniref:Helix-turn-helix domain-containing protein n=1 Tax=Acinetobacter ursingii TaxID=108980 RepID=A0A7T9UH97_9GAMM|nr:MULTISPECIES: helix-turn-helix transcriptional regulator [Acinetobacter]ENX48796.1 hypothetical protein F943_02333 [Acinetobacter ursingii NIPH 706]EXD37937.1 cro/C1-type HTH DNA-binding domain protein [Acinetobacter sp. 479375]MCH2014667.1 helix-turn-helix transcriptional regulator [Acinetobacter ursingii]MCU4587442.1 helix-turn-helix transcriptional regulator [Acinetobacter ursingii]QQT85790.1 helix-turn-helix domain-containing protein [Acinetobacter ursingii]
MSSLNTKNNSELENPLKERIKLLMTENELEKPYSFATRVGLSKGTFTGIWKEGRSSLHNGTVNKICVATGANPAWLTTGIGEPFISDQKINNQVNQGAKQKNLNTQISLNTDLLAQAFDTMDKALKVTNRTMTPQSKAKFVVSIYDNLNEETELKAELLQECIYTIEQALLDTRRTMSSTAKSELISIIYDLYYGNAAYKEAMKTTLDELIRSTS